MPQDDRIIAMKYSDSRFGESFLRPSLLKTRVTPMLYEITAAKLRQNFADGLDIVSRDPDAIIVITKNGKPWGGMISFEIVKLLITSRADVEKFLNDNSNKKDD